MRAALLFTPVAIAGCADQCRYPRFYFEGLYVPPEQRFMPEMDDRLRGEALELRMRLESVAKNSSKSAHVRSKIVGKSSQLVVAAPLKLKVFQQLTASHKKFVFLEEDGLHVLKGPYVLPQDRNRFNLNIQMTRRIVELDAARAVRSDTSCGPDRFDNAHGFVSRRFGQLSSRWKHALVLQWMACF